MRTPIPAMSQVFRELSPDSAAPLLFSHFVFMLTTLQQWQTHSLWVRVRVWFTSRLYGIDLIGEYSPMNEDRMMDRWLIRSFAKKILKSFSNIFKLSLHWWLWVTERVSTGRLLLVCQFTSPSYMNKYIADSSADSCDWPIHHDYLHYIHKGDYLPYSEALANGGLFCFPATPFFPTLSNLPQ